MSDLPNFRIPRECAPFENVAVDYFGPFYLKFGRRQRIKAYGVVYTCLTTRAVYLELATSLKHTQFFTYIKEIYKFIWQAETYTCDNGSNFRGASREIAVMIKRWKENAPDHEQLKEFLLSYEIKWTFSTPVAPHHNGAVESMVKSVKSALNKVVKHEILTEE